VEEIEDALKTGSVLLEGAMGVGKSRLGFEVADRWSSRDNPVEVAMGSPAAAAIPFGAVSHLVPPLPSADLLLMLEQTRRSITDLGGSRPLLLVVEDLHHLDAASFALVERLVGDDTNRVLLTIRSEERDSAQVAALARKSGVATVRVEPLNRADVQALLGSLFVGEPDEALLESVWELSRGNPLFVEEIAKHAKSTGAVDDDGSTVTVSSALTPSRLLKELVDERFQKLSSGERSATEVVAAVEPIALDLVSQTVSPVDIERAADADFVRIDRQGTRETVRTTHPLYGEVIRDAMTRVRVSEIVEELATALLARRVDKSADTLTAAVWLLEAGRHIPTEIALPAAREALARGDPSLALQFGDMALAESKAVAALVTAGTACSLDGNAARARELMSEALRKADNDDDRAESAIAYARHLGWREDDFETAIDVLNRTFDSVASDDVGSRLRLEESALIARRGDLEGALRVADGVVTQYGTDPEVALRALVWSTLARVMLGRFDRLSEDLDEADRLADGDGDPLVLDQIGANRIMYSTLVDLDHARHLSISGHADCLRRGGAPVIWSLCDIAVEVSRGDVERAIRLAQRARDEAAVFDPFHNSPMATCLLGLTQALAGDETEAAVTLESIDEPDSLEPRTRLWFDRAHFWLAAHKDSDDLENMMHAAIGRAVDADLITWAADHVFDGVRVGHPEISDGLLEDLAGQVSHVPIIDLLARASDAVLDVDISRIDELTQLLLGRGARLVAAELNAVVASRTSGLKSNRLAVKAFEILAACPGARPPVFASLQDPLSERERQVARIAAIGATSREIAADLYLSPRTVDNHLARVYGKLGLSGREELHAVLPAIAAAGPATGL